MKAALRTLYRILKPGGVLLVTSPGISQVGQGVPGTKWYWAFTHDSISRLLEEVFPSANIHVEDHGNVFAAVAFLHGLALEEIPTDATGDNVGKPSNTLDRRDAGYPVIIAARAVEAWPGDTGIPPGGLRDRFRAEIRARIGRDRYPGGYAKSRSICGPHELSACRGWRSRGRRRNVAVF